MRSFIEDLVNQLRFADVLAITVMAILLYILFVWLRDRASRSLGLVVLALASLFLLSRWLDMYLTKMIGRYGIVGILLARVVVFQHDIRHGVERLASSHWFCRTLNQQPTRQTAGTIVEAVVVMAEQLNFHSHTAPTEREHNYRLSQWWTSSGAVIAAISLWFAFAYHTDTIKRTFVVSIEYRNLPSGFEIDEPKPTHVEATLSGPEQAFTLLSPTRIAVSLKIEDVRGYEALRWQTATNLGNVPAELEIERTTPDAIAISVRPKSRE